MLGLYDEGGAAAPRGLHQQPAGDQRRGLAERLERLIEPPGLTERAPGGPSRWSTERSAEWEPLRPELVVRDTIMSQETGSGTARFLRWQPDKGPRQCRMSQLR
jgi:hypothetical protein